MAALTNKTREAKASNSAAIGNAISHSDMSAAPVNLMEAMCGKGVHAMMGSGWRSDEHTVRDLTTWTVLQQDGPNHLGLW